MKKLFLAIALCLTSITLFSQSFNTGELLQPNHFSAGINPVIENNSPGVYIHGGYGIWNIADINFKYGFIKGANYMGSNLKWGLRNTRKMNLSLITGAHYVSYFGLDIGLAASFPVTTYVTLFSGLDCDINLNNSDDRFFWIPLGVEIRLSKMVSIILEADIPVVDFAPGIFGGGVAVYLD